MAMTRELDSATASLLDGLSQTPTQQLVILVTQHASLPVHTSRALRTLAGIAIRNVGPLRGAARLHAQQLLDVMRRLIERGDPSQARRLVPLPAALVDLAICIDARDVLARLLDEQGAEDLLKAAFMTFERVAALDTFEQRKAQVGRAAFVLSRLLFSLPRRRHSQTTARRGQTPKQAFPDVRDTVRLLSSLRQQYEQLRTSPSASETDQKHLVSKVALLDAAWAMFDHHMAVSSKVTSTDLDKLLVASAGGVDDGSTPMADLSMLTDLAIARPLIPMLRHTGSQTPSLDALAQKINKIAPGCVGQTQLDKLSGAWKQAVSVITEPTSSADDAHIDADLLATITAILPRWTSHIDKLKSKLSASPFVGLDNDLIVEMLLDEEESQGSSDVQGRRSPQTAEAHASSEMDILRQRANVFDDESLESATVLHGKGKGRANERIVLGSGLPEDLKASILSRAEAPDSDEEDRAEWDPFADTALEVGFEEELGDGEEDVASRFVQRRVADGSDVEEEEQDPAEVEEGEADGRRGASGHGAVHGTSNAHAGERETERILISAWKEAGEAQFAKQARNTSARKALLDRLNGAPGSKRWDDQLIESWGAMFNRNVSVGITVTQSFINRLIAFMLLLHSHEKISYLPPLTISCEWATRIAQTIKPMLFLRAALAQTADGEDASSDPVMVVAAGRDADADGEAVVAVNTVAEVVVEAAGEQVFQAVGAVIK